MAAENREKVSSKPARNSLGARNNRACQPGLVQGTLNRSSRNRGNREADLPLSYSTLQFLSRDIILLHGTCIPFTYQYNSFRQQFVRSPHHTCRRNPRLGFDICRARKRSHPSTRQYPSRIARPVKLRSPSCNRSGSLPRWRRSDRAHTRSCQTRRRRYLHGEATV